MARPTAQTPPSLRSIQMTTASGSPFESTPWSTRSANRPRSVAAFTPGLCHFEPGTGGARQVDHRGCDRDVPGGETVGLEDDDVLVRLAARRPSGDNLLQLVQLEPVEDARGDG